MERNLVVLTMDPSIRAWGYAVIKNGKPIFADCIKTAPEKKVKRIRKSDDRAKRISEINNALIKAIKKHEVNYIVAEAPHGSQSAASAVMIGIVSAITQTLADAFELPVDFYSEGEVKKFLLGKKAASKQEMVNKVEKELNIQIITSSKDKQEAIADAYGVYLTARYYSPLLRFIT